MQAGENANEMCLSRLRIFVNNLTRPYRKHSNSIRILTILIHQINSLNTHIRASHLIRQ